MQHAETRCNIFRQGDYAFLFTAHQHWRLPLSSKAFLTCFVSSTCCVLFSSWDICVLCFCIGHMHEMSSIHPHVSGESSGGSPAVLSHGLNRTLSGVFTRWLVGDNLEPHLSHTAPLENVRRLSGVQCLSENGCEGFIIKIDLSGPNINISIKMLTVHSLWSMRLINCHFKPLTKILLTSN